MNYDDAIVEFLAQPANIEYAFQISERIESVREKIMKDFWSSLYSKMEEYLITKNIDWKIKNYGKKYTENWTGYQLRWESELIHPDLNLGFGCMQEDRGGGKFYLYWSILWYPYQFSSDPDIAIPTINKIKVYCSEKKYRSDPRWGIGWDWFNFFVGHKDFCIRFVNERDAVIDNFHQCVVEKFEEFKIFIQDANIELKFEIDKDNSPIKNAFALFKR